MTVDEALAVIEQERLDVLSEGMSEEDVANTAAYVLASAIRKDRKFILSLHESLIAERDEMIGRRDSAQVDLEGVCDERDKLRELLRIEYLRHGAIETPWICVEADCPRSGKSVFITGCNCKLDFEMRHIAAVKKELGL